MAKPAFVVYAVSNKESWGAEDPTRESFPITMIHFQPIAWLILSAQQAQAAVIRATPI
jgi:hypothetical protein